MPNRRVLINLFQPVGLLGGLLALGVWIPAFLIQKRYILGTKVFNGYPAALHSEQIFALFVLPMLTGFVLRLQEHGRGTAEKPRASSEIALLLLAEIVLFPLSLFPDRTAFYFIFALTAATVLVFAFRGAKAQTGTPSHGNFLLVVALFFQAAGAIFLLLTPSAAQGGGLHRLGRAILFYGVMPLAIAAFGLLLAGDENKAADKSIRLRVRLLVIAFGATFAWDLGAFLVSKSEPSSLGELLRGLVFAFALPSFFSLRDWSRRGPRGVLVLIALLFALTGLLGSALDAAHGAHLAHFYFVGAVSFFLFTANDLFRRNEDGRGITTQGGSGSSRLWWSIVALLMLAAATRATAHIWPRILFSHLLYAAVAHLIALVAWGVYIMKDETMKGDDIITGDDNQGEAMTEDPIKDEIKSEN